MLRIKAYSYFAHSLNCLIVNLLKTYLNGIQE